MSRENSIDLQENLDNISLFIDHILAGNYAKAHEIAKEIKPIYNTEPISEILAALYKKDPQRYYKFLFVNEIRNQKHPKTERLEELLAEIARPQRFLEQLKENRQIFGQKYREYLNYCPKEKPAHIKTKKVSFKTDDTAPEDNPSLDPKLFLALPGERQAAIITFLMNKGKSTILEEIDAADFDYARNIYKLMKQKNYSELLKISEKNTRIAKYFVRLLKNKNIPADDFYDFCDCVVCIVFRDLCEFVFSVIFVISCIL